jgi:hypothetical protein
MDPVVVYVLRCIQNGLDSLGLKALEDFDAGIGSWLSPIAEFHRSIWIYVEPQNGSTAVFTNNFKHLMMTSVGETCSAMYGNFRIRFKETQCVMFETFKCI